MYTYYPSCNFTKSFPETSALVRSYLAAQDDVRVAGCCHRTSALPEAGDTIVTVCMSCMRGLMEMRPDCPQLSLFELLLTREDFAWPKLTGRTYVLQDCFRARGCHGIHEAVRECIRRTGATIVELEANRDLADFDGRFLLRGASCQNTEEAPRYFVDYLSQHVTPLPKEQWAGVYQAQVEKYHGLPAIGYCNTCVNAAREGGAEAYHLAELLFAT